jgi:hypothetical protein
MVHVILSSVTLTFIITLTIISWRPRARFLGCRARLIWILLQTDKRLRVSSFLFLAAAAPSSRGFVAGSFFVQLVQTSLTAFEHVFP